jgi:hypothetical protein
MPKKNNPGCNCCEGEDCTTRCLYKCTGTPPCPFPCAIQIDTPTPDIVSKSTGATCPEADCDVSAECFQCKALFDGLFFLHASSRFTQRPGWWQTGWSGSSCENQTNVIYQESIASETMLSCWTPYNYLCPEETYLWDFSQCIPEYNVVLNYSLNPPYSTKITVNVTYADGCSTTEVIIEYTVGKTCDAIGIPPNPFVNPETTYTHTFRRTNQCNCDDILGALTYISTSSVNNSRGVTVPDVCNMDAATVSLVGNGSQCGCLCLTCLGTTNELTLTVTDDPLAGTYLLTNEAFDITFPSPTDTRSTHAQCYFVSTLFSDPTKQWIVVIKCLSCDTVNIELWLKTSGIDEPVKIAEALGIPCSDPINLTTLIGDGTYALS